MDLKSEIYELFLIIKYAPFSLPNLAIFQFLLTKIHNPSRTSTDYLSFFIE